MLVQVVNILSEFANYNKCVVTFGRTAELWLYDYTRKFGSPGLIRSTVFHHAL